MYSWTGTFNYYKRNAEISIQESDAVKYGSNSYFNVATDVLASTRAVSRKPEGLYFKKATKKRNGFVGGSCEWDSWDFD